MLFGNDYKKKYLSLYEFSTRFLSKMICGTDHTKKRFLSIEFLYESLTNSYSKMLLGNDYKEKVVPNSKLSLIMSLKLDPMEK